MLRHLSLVILATSFVHFGGLAAAQTNQSPGQGTYRPGLGDMMTMTVQPRHIKLAEAAREHNWTYAAYELHELQEAFDRVAAVWPGWQHYPISAMIKFNLAGPFSALEAAIKANDSTKFDAAYKQLTESCDSCHQAAGRAMVVIKVPSEANFPDQDFAPRHE